MAAFVAAPAAAGPLASGLPAARACSRCDSSWRGFGAGPARTEREPSSLRVVPLVAAAAFLLPRLQRQRRLRGRPVLTRVVVRAAEADAAVVDVVDESAPKKRERKKKGYFQKEGWQKSLGIVPPDDVRNRISYSKSFLDKHQLGFLGDVVWEFLVLRHQYKQLCRSPFTTTPDERIRKQSKAARMLMIGRALNTFDKKTMKWGASYSWRPQARLHYDLVTNVGIEPCGAAHGLRVLLGWHYIDSNGDDERLEKIVREIGLLSEQGEEDRLLGQVTEGMWDPVDRSNATFFLALQPLGNVALRLYISRYFMQRPQRDDEFMYRVKLALRESELDVAAAGFMRDFATVEELELMRRARVQKDSYAFAFECLLGHLALTLPYRLHQVVAEFGWAIPLPGT